MLDNQVLICNSPHISLYEWKGTKRAFLQFNMQKRRRSEGG